MTSSASLFCYAAKMSSQEKMLKKSKNRIGDIRFDDV